MPFYDNKFYYDTLKFDDVFTSASDFETKMVSVGGITDSSSLQELYEILAMKYVGANTRYTDSFSFMKAIKRELYVEFPYYLEKKSLVDELIALTDAEIELAQVQLRNLVDTHDEPITNADTVAFDDLSTQQENFRTTIGKLQSKRDKYNMMNRDYRMGIYKKCDELFRVILSSDNYAIYEETE